MDGDDAHDHWRDLQFCRIRLRGCDSGYTFGSLICGNHDNPICDIPKRTIEYGWESWMLSVHYRVGCYCHECAFGIICGQYPGDAEVCDSARIPVLCRCHYCLLYIHCILGRTKIWKKNYDGIFDHLQFDWRSQCSSNPRSGCCHCCTNWGNATVQPVVPLCAARFRHYDSRY